MSLKLFNTKEEYLAFRKAFANAVNDDKAKHHYEEVTRSDYRTGSNELVRIRTDGWVQSQHFLLLNILRGKPFDYGFTTITNKTKLENGFISHEGLYNAMRRLQNLCGYADKLHKNKPVADWYIGHLLAFMQPFNGTVKLELLSKINELLPQTVYLKTESKFLQAMVDSPYQKAYNEYITQEENNI